MSKLSAVVFGSDGFWSYLLFIPSSAYVYFWVYSAATFISVVLPSTLEPRILYITKLTSLIKVGAPQPSNSLPPSQSPKNRSPNSYIHMRSANLTQTYLTFSPSSSSCCSLAIPICQPQSDLSILPCLALALISTRGWKLNCLFGSTADQSHVCSS